MATFESLAPHIYLLLETRSKHFDAPDDVRNVALHVNGISSVFTVRISFGLAARSAGVHAPTPDVETCSIQIFLPTTELSLALVSEHQLLQWVELAEGEVLRACDLDVGQRALVVTLIRAYRACYFQLVPSEEVGLLFRLIVEAAMALDDHEPADEVLDDLVTYIRGAFPTVRSLVSYVFQTAVRTDNCLCRVPLLSAAISRSQQVL